MLGEKLAQEWDVQKPVSQIRRHVRWLQQGRIKRRTFKLAALFLFQENMLNCSFLFLAGVRCLLLRCKQWRS